MFIPTIEKQGTKEQIAKYVEPAKKFKILGTYAQTELGHGMWIYITNEVRLVLFSR
jgi:acyl-CoA oxidase